MEKQKPGKTKDQIMIQLEQKKQELAKLTKERQKRENDDEMLFSMMGIENKITKASSSLLQTLNEPFSPT